MCHHAQAHRAVLRNVYVNVLSFASLQGIHLFSMHTFASLNPDLHFSLRTVRGWVLPVCLSLIYRERLHTFIKCVLLNRVLPILAGEKTYRSMFVILEHSSCLMLLFQECSKTPSI